MEAPTFTIHDSVVQPHGLSCYVLMLWRSLRIFTSGALILKLLDASSRVRHSMNSLEVDMGTAPHRVHIVPLTRVHNATIRTGY